MAWVQNNPNPHGKYVGDCTVRAIANALQKEWHDVYFGLCLQGALMGDMPSSNAVTTAYLRKHGMKRRTVPESCPDCYCIEDFCRDHPQGVYVIGTGSHLASVIDGDLHDSWDSRAECPVYFFCMEG